MDIFLLDPILRHFLAEDLEHGDITTEAIFSPADQSEACFIARHPMTVVGMVTVASRVFQLLDPAVCCEHAAADGSRVEQGAELLHFRGHGRFFSVGVAHPSVGELLEITDLIGILQLCGMANAVALGITFPDRQSAALDHPAQTAGFP